MIFKIFHVKASPVWPENKPNSYQGWIRKKNPGIHPSNRFIWPQKWQFRLNFFNEILKFLEIQSINRKMIILM